MRRANRIGRAIAAAAAAVLLLGVTACTSSSASDLPSQRPGAFPSDVQKRMESALTDAMTLADASAGFAGVWAPWAGSWTTASGTTTRGGSAPVTEDMTFRIGQNTLPMTCTVFLQLVDDGTMGIDDPLSKWIPDLVGVDGITMRELCQDTSGLGDYSAQLNGRMVMNPIRQWPPLELASEGIAAPRTGKPGEKHSPARTNAVLVGMAVRNAAGADWPELYEKHLFEPLGMDASVLPESSTLVVPGAHPAGYSASVDGVGAVACDPVRDVSRLSPSGGWTSGGVVSNLHDLKAFSQALAAGSLLEEKTADAQMTGVTSGASWQKQGLGVELLGPLRGSTGAIPGYLSAMYTDPASGLTVVVALNNSTPGSGFARALAQRFASIASKIPGAAKGAKVVAALPWSEEQTVDAMTKSAPCPAKAPAAK
ncbi:beta-lactamase [Leifsonia sp. LS1]|uniref:serine hydrolase domain-containing protein n=1 Tax=Leifsonia sp. LS1 TaxID=2828483 RepID=UPI001CFEFAB4|nr:serine hydrolase domain-containing protein [Leifsonia sp. LS1]GIT78552.1 beta-lactamase [Leifsonia sp. LS1]